MISLKLEMVFLQILLWLDVSVAQSNRRHLSVQEILLTSHLSLITRSIMMDLLCHTLMPDHVCIYLILKLKFALFCLDFYYF